MVTDFNLSAKAEKEDPIFLKIKSVKPKDILLVKDELIHLFEMEVKARDTYFQELRRFDGEAFETIKWLSDQEGRHIQILETILSKANVIVQEPKTEIVKMSSNRQEIIKFDLSFEDLAVKDFSSAAEKSSGALQEILADLMDEEIVHVERLRKYVP